ncbi:MAG: hypothetical protein HY040_07725 [Planctomycetes bacterium]|nr:hypothetical protein [Planctomycetota bacterium]
MGASFHVTLDFIGSEPQGLRFRVAFDSSQARWLLPYPEVTGLRFVPLADGDAPEWTTRYLVTEPQDEFVLNPDDRIAFDLVARVNASIEIYRWTLQLAPAEYDVRYIYEVDSGKARYDYLGKGSRFADLTPPLVGTVESNAVRVSLAAASVRG